MKLRAEKYLTGFYDNTFFDRLFPRIKQQKPGVDLYTFVASISIFIIFYIILFTNGMMGSKLSVSDQFSGGKFSAIMVISMMAMMGIMVVDRLFYAGAKEQSRKTMEGKLHTDQALTGQEHELAQLDAENNTKDNFQDWL